MKTCAEGGTSTPSNERRGSKTSVPPSSRRSVTRTLARGIFVRSVKLSFRSIAGIDDANDEIAPLIEPFHGEVKLRRRGDQLEGVDRRRPHAYSLGVHGDGSLGRQVEVEGAVLAEGISGPHAI